MNETRKFVGCRECQTADQHVQHVKRLLSEHPEQAQRIAATIVDQAPAVRVAASHALGELAAMGSDMAALLAAVDAGGSLVMTGPDPLGSNAAPRFAGTIESHSGAREAHATGASLLEMVSGLAHAWSTAK